MTTFKAPALAAALLLPLFSSACDCRGPGLTSVDRDHDGSAEGDDCDDGDPAVHPQAPEVCNGRDDSCDGRVDEGCALGAWHVPASGSAFGAALQTSASYTNVGILGEPTPPATAGATELKSPSYRNLGGFVAALPHR